MLKLKSLFLATTLLGSFVPNIVSGQDLEPKFLSKMPIGGNFLVDNTLPIEILTDFV